MNNFVMNEQMAQGFAEHDAKRVGTIDWPFHPSGTDAVSWREVVDYEERMKVISDFTRSNALVFQSHN